MTENKWQKVKFEILVLTVRMLVKGRFYHYYVSIMHIHRSVICSFTQRIIIPHVSSFVSPFGIHDVRSVYYPIDDISDYYPTYNIKS